MWRLSHFYCLVSIRRYFMRFQKCFINLLCIWKTKLFQIIMAPKRRYFTATTKPKFSWIGEEIQPPPHMGSNVIFLTIPLEVQLGYGGGEGNQFVKWKSTNNKVRLGKVNDFLHGKNYVIFPCVILFFHNFMDWRPISPPPSRCAGFKVSLINLGSLSG